MAQIEVNLSLRRLKLFSRSEVISNYPVAIGKPATPTPTGSYYITRKVMHPGGVLGTRWMELSIPSTGGRYGIHGTSQPWSIGKAISKGCIRMYNHDVEKVFDLVKIGTPVEIRRGGLPDEPHLVSPGNNPGDGYYTVKPGDTLWQVAQRFNTTMAELQRLNYLPDPSLIYPGQRLRLPPH
ncbi:MAG TPA: L,D-transpeptidase family protein [Clostridia bacterium]|nr:L,D-transpeptidase family protein [Clostridia bacterium]